MRDTSPFTPLVQKNRDRIFLFPVAWKISFIPSSNAQGAVTIASFSYSLIRVFCSRNFGESASCPRVALPRIRFMWADLCGTILYAVWPNPVNGYSLPPHTVVSLREQLQVEATLASVPKAGGGKESDHYRPATIDDPSTPSFTVPADSAHPAGC